MPEELRTELHPEVAEALASAKESGTDVNSSDLSVDGARQVKQDAITQMGWLSDPEPVENVRDYSLPTDSGSFPIRIYTPDAEPPHPILVWIHGGGWVRDSIDGNDPICRAITNQTPCSVVSVGYRLAPEHPFPAGLRDCYTALSWIANRPNIALGDGDALAVGGKSAGGNLTVALSLLASHQDGPTIHHQAPCVPVLDRPRNTTSYQENATGYGLSRPDMEWYWDHYLDDPFDSRHQYAAPLQSPDLSDLPPATVLTAGFDPLRDDGIEYVNRLKTNGVPVTHHHFPDMPHTLTGTGYFYQDIGRTREAISTLSKSLATAFDTQ
jgi:acetyl esterase